MNAKALVRIGAAALVVLAIAAAAIELGRDEDGARQTVGSTEQQGEASPDPLQYELLRCQELGEAGARDEACLRAWAESRRRFLGGYGQVVEDPSSAPEAE